MGIFSMWCRNHSPPVEKVPDHPGAVAPDYVCPVCRLHYGMDKILREAAIHRAVEVMRRGQ